MPYDHQQIEKKWREKWESSQTFKTQESPDKPKFYALDMFPYPSGSGLHVGHPEGYTATDIFSRYKRMKGFNVLHPMGYDAFGLPAEQCAMQTGTHPAVTTNKNCDTFRRQIKWLGLRWSELYYQSKRTKIYEKYLKQLLNEGKAYKKEIIWFKNPNKKIIFDDLIRSRVEFNSDLFGDFSLAKDLKTPLYNFAAVIDDYEMKISHVIRGEDHISNTPKQILIQEALNLPSPKYAHLPLILGPDKSKLSKRHGAVSLADYKKQGYLPEAMVNFMVLLGWNPGTDKEVFSLKELVKEFSLEKIQRGGAIFNIEKLNWFNSYYIKQLPLEKLTKFCIPYLIKDGLIKPNFERRKLKKIIALEQERMTKFSEVGELTEFFFKEPRYERNLLRWKNMTDQEISESINKLEKILSGVKKNDFNAKKLEKILMPEAERLDNRGRLLWPLRVALTGRKASPGPFDIAEILGKEETMQRLKQAKKLLQ